MVTLLTRVAVLTAPLCPARIPEGAGVVTGTGCDRPEWFPLPSKASTVY
jgi:hypothetical protein